MLKKINSHLRTYTDSIWKQFSRFCIEINCIWKYLHFLAIIFGTVNKLIVNSWEFGLNENEYYYFFYHRKEKWARQTK